MSKVDFTKFLETRVSDVKPPPLLPGGTYALQILGEPINWGESSQKKTPYVEFTLQVMEPMEDVDQSELPENWQSKKLRTQFYLTDEALFMLVEFGQKLGIEAETVKEIIEGIPGHIVLGEVIQITPEANERNPEPRPTNRLDRLIGPAD